MVGAITSFGLTAGTDTTVHAAGAGYTFGTVNLGSSYTFSDTDFTLRLYGKWYWWCSTVVISPKDGHGSDAVENWVDIML